MVPRPSPSGGMSVRVQAQCAVVAVLLGTLGCSPKNYVMNQAADVLSEDGDSTVWTGEEDPELVRESLPFALKTMESLRDANPKHVGLHKALAARFMAYAFLFVQEDADRLQGKSYAAAQEGWERARKLYRRAHTYALQGLDLSHPGFSKALKTDPKAAVKVLTRQDVELAYWCAVSLAAEISLSKTRPDVVAEWPSVDAIMQQLLKLDENWDKGALHGFMIVFELRGESMGGSPQRAREHFEKAVKLTGGNSAGPYMSWAESFCVPKQDLACFNEHLDKALAVDVNKVPAWRMQNIVSQRRATWLKTRAADLIDVPTPDEENG